VQMRGRGMVVTDGRCYIKGSDIDADRSSSRGRVEARFGLYSDYRALRAAAWKPEERNYWQEFRKLSTSLSKVYEEPAKARGAFLRLAEKSRPDALRRLLDEPERFGRLRPLDPAERRGKLQEAAVAASRFIQARADRPRPTLKIIAARVREGERLLAAHAAVPGAAQTAGMAKADLQVAYERRKLASQAVGEARDAIRSTYADPARAERAIWRHVQREGGAATAEAIREAPEQFGKLRPEPGQRSWRVWKDSPDTSKARETAPATARAVRTAAAAVERAPDRDAINALRGRAAGADAALTAARSAATAPAPAGLHAEIASLLQRATMQAQQLGVRMAGEVAKGPQQLLEKAGAKHVQQLAVMVKAPHVAVVKAAVELGLKMARGDDGRDGGGRGR